MDDEARVRDALGRVADESPAGDSVWDATQGRIRRRRHRRALLAGAVAVLAIAVGIGAVVAATDDDRPDVVVQPPEQPTARPDIVGVVDGELVVISSADGSVEGRIGEADAAHPIQEVGASPDGEWVAFTQQFDPTPGCSDTPKLNEVRPGPTPEFDTLVGASIRWPVVSPDGHAVAYEMRECGPIGDVGITTLGDDNRNYRFAVDGERPLAWTLDSDQLLVVQGEGEYRLVDAPRGGTSEAVNLPAGATAAAFVAENEVVLASNTPDGAEIAAYEIATGTKRVLSTYEGRAITSLAYDARSDALLAVASATGSPSGVGKGPEAAGLVIRQGNEETFIPFAGLTDAVWFDAPVAAVTATTTSSSSSTSTSTSTTTTTVPIGPLGQLPPANGFAGVTAWTPLDLSTLGVSFLAEAASPQAKIDQLVADFLAEPVEGRTSAEGVIASGSVNRYQIEVRVIGMADDSIGGVDYRVYLLQEQTNGPWKVVSIEERSLCSRGFDGTFCV
jgi:hypothetical protein